jgi:hypothetical protein
MTETMHERNTGPPTRSRHHRMRNSRTAAVLIVVLLGPILTSCDEDRSLDPVARTDGSSELSCHRVACVIELDRIATLSDSSGDLPEMRLYVEQDRQGRLLVPAAYGAHFLVYDASGSLLRRVGRRGDGPGEFRFAQTPLTGPGDSLHVSQTHDSAE